MTVRELIERLRSVRNPEAKVSICTQLSTDFDECVVSEVHDNSNDPDDGAVWLYYSGADLNLSENDVILLMKPRGG